MPYSTEICPIRRTRYASQYPGLYVFTGPGRLIRPVVNNAAQRHEWIGCFEQVYLNCSVDESDVCTDGAMPTTHRELNKQAILSVIGSMTPFSEFNQSPRNLYQCQVRSVYSGHCPPRHVSSLESYRLCR